MTKPDPKYYEMADDYAEWIDIEWTPAQREVAAAYMEMRYADD